VKNKKLSILTQEALNNAMRQQPLMTTAGAGHANKQPNKPKNTAKKYNLKLLFR
jgi:hypothetical protein